MEKEKEELKTYNNYFSIGINSLFEESIASSPVMNNELINPSLEELNEWLKKLYRSKKGGRVLVQGISGLIDGAAVPIFKEILLPNGKFWERKRASLGIGRYSLEELEFIKEEDGKIKVILRGKNSEGQVKEILYTWEKYKYEYFNEKVFEDIFKISGDSAEILELRLKMYDFISQKDYHLNAINLMTIPKEDHKKLLLLRNAESPSDPIDFTVPNVLNGKRVVFRVNQKGGGYGQAIVIELNDLEGKDSILGWEVDSRRKKLKAEIDALKKVSHFQAASPVNVQAPNWSELYKDFEFAIAELMNNPVFKKFWEGFKERERGPELQELYDEIYKVVLEPVAFDSNGKALVRISVVSLIFNIFTVSQGMESPFENELEILQKIKILLRAKFAAARAGMRLKDFQEKFVKKEKSLTNDAGTKRLLELFSTRTVGAELEQLQGSVFIQLWVLEFFGAEEGIMTDEQEIEIIKPLYEVYVDSLWSEEDAGGQEKSKLSTLNERLIREINLKLGQMVTSSPLELQEALKAAIKSTEEQLADIQAMRQEEEANEHFERVKELTDLEEEEESRLRSLRRIENALLYLDKLFITTLESSIDSEVKDLAERAQEVIEKKVKEKGESSSSLRREGGINLDPELLDLQIKRDGNGIPLPVWDQPIESMKIEGFVPIIINITPVNLPLFLGLVDENGDVPFDAADGETSGSIPMDFRLGFIFGWPSRESALSRTLPGRSSDLGSKEKFIREHEGEKGKV